MLPSPVVEKIAPLGPAVAGVKYASVRVSGKANIIKRCFLI
jgi:hypothetical protein